jgi:hypothetical protein
MGSSRDPHIHPFITIHPSIHPSIHSLTQYLLSVCARLYFMRKIAMSINDKVSYDMLSYNKERIINFARF